MNPLPDREKAVLQGVRDGKSERRIALEMGCSINNVKQAKQSLFNRWGVSTQACLVDQGYIRGVFTIPTKH